MNLHKILTFLLVITFLFFECEAFVPNACINPFHFALTFDDGPSGYSAEFMLIIRLFLFIGRAETLAVLAVLQRKRVKATFHVSTEAVKLTADLIQRILSEGHTLGFRYDPSVHDMNTLSLSQITKTLDNARNSVKKLFSYNVKFLRLPFRAYSDFTVKHVEKLGFIVTEHSLDSYDYAFKNGTQVLAHFSNTLKKNCSHLGGCRVQQSALPSGYISLHRDASLLTVHWLFAIINLIYDSRLQFVNLEQCLGFNELKN